MPHPNDSEAVEWTSGRLTIITHAHAPALRSIGCIATLSNRPSSAIDPQVNAAKKPTLFSTLCPPCHHPFNSLGVDNKRSSLNVSVTYAGDADKIDAVAAAPTVGKVVTEVHAVDTKRFARPCVLDILFDDFGVTEARPTVV